MVQPDNSSSSQHTQQFLSSVLSAGGPSAVPYREDVKWLIRQQLVSLSDAYPSLQSKTAVFTHNDGRTVRLLQSQGTIPIVFNQVTYNIPIIIWLMDSFPRHPPLVLVDPTPHMIIKNPHPFVSPSGIVSIPYLQNWLYPTSNLLELATNLIHFFSRDPPLYSQRPTLNPNPSSPNVYTSAISAARPRPYPPSPYGDNTSGGGNCVDNQLQAFTRSAINKLVESLHSDIGGMRKAREADMEGLFTAQAVLRQRQGELLKGVKEMQDEKEGLEQQLQMELMNVDVLEGWFRENERKVAALKDVDVDDTFEHIHVLSKQVSDSTASDLAIEDAIYALDKAVQEGAVPFDQYLRNVRLLSRQQFIHRATASKVRDAQMRTQVAYIASRPPAYML